MFQGMEYVYMVYKEKSFSKAAQKLFISQPSLSATIKRVESKIGYPIFDRSTKPITLTECGKEYIKAVERVLSSEKEFINYINDWGELKVGSLVLGGSSLFSSWVLPPLMGEFNKHFPHVKVELVEESTAELAALLQKGKIDFMIDNCVMSNSVFDSRIYQDEHLLLAVPKHFPSTQAAVNYQISPKMISDRTFLEKHISAVPLHLFKDEPFIMLKPENDTGKRAAELLQKYNMTPTMLFQLDQQLTAYNITCSGMGISFVSDTLITRVPPHPDVLYYKLEEDISCRKIFFYWKDGRYFTRAMEEFLKCAQCSK
ncbi:LysR family transcriptional regulator [Clostridium sp. C105KSO13]|uniref:LysR family transcriptional regulator n=1 Tax=Clostridium sp. C105KSO13 TaxID=1776045 RepID=UPI0007406515|nr:LysR family transcriptional regulator [Clostridium sp. C105KSO13]CUX44885.1 HTH-type transcriptional regulator CynR [Clostridium sp. C105KSO13]